MCAKSPCGFEQPYPAAVGTTGTPTVKQFDVEFRFKPRNAGRDSWLDTAARCAPFVNPPASATAMKCLI